jgi:Fur family ferric uptake transcriptional regulator
VYDILTALHRNGLVRRIEPAGSPALFEIPTGDDHHHLVCRSCGVIVDVDGAVGAAPCLIPPTSNGFIIDEAEVTFCDFCPTCNIRTEADDNALEANA